MTLLCPGLSQEEQAPSSAPNTGVRFLSPQPGRTYIEVEPNFVTLHFALNLGTASADTLLLRGDWVPVQYRTAFHERDTARSPSGPVGVVWRPDGALALEGHAANSIGSWVSGKVRGKRAGGTS